MYKICKTTVLLLLPPVDLKLSLNFETNTPPSCLVVNTPYVSHCSHCFLSTQCVSYHTSQPFPFYPEAWIRRYSCYHTHTPFIDMTSITARGRLASAQPMVYISCWWSTFRATEKPLVVCPEGGFALSASGLPCIDSWTKGLVPRITRSIWPHPPISPHPLHLPPNTPPVQRCKAGGCYMHVVSTLCAYSKVCLLSRWQKACMKPDGCLGGLNHLVLAHVWMTVEVLGLQMVKTLW